MDRPRKWIYISHPLTGDEENNRKKAREVTTRLFDRGLCNRFIFINPLDLFYGQSLSRHKWDHNILYHAVEVMRRCDGVIFCEGWQKSRGCRLEHYVAWKMGLPRWQGADAFLESFEEEHFRFLEFDSRLITETMFARGRIDRYQYELYLSGTKLVYLQEREKRGEVIDWEAVEKEDVTLPWNP